MKRSHLFNYYQAQQEWSDFRLHRRRLRRQQVYTLGTVLSDEGRKFPSVIVFFS